MTDIVIPYSKQDITEADINAVVAVLRSRLITQGPEIDRFEKAVADYCGARYAVAVSNGSAALHIACLAAGLGPDEYLWTSPITFVASANCGLYCGANIDFIDIQHDSYNINVVALANKLQVAEKLGKLPKVVVVTHFAGQSCEMERIAELASQYGFIIVEDACHAAGGSYKERKIGSCTYSDMAVFSFHPVKSITTGEGGMVLTNDDHLYNKLLRLRSHGIERNPELMTQEPHGAWYYEQVELGFNYRMTDIQAALGSSQLSRIDNFIAHRRRIAERYNHELCRLPLSLPWQHSDCQSAWHLYVVRVDGSRSRMSHRAVFDGLRNAGIGVNLHYIPVHLQPFYRQLGFKAGDFPEAEKYYQEAISLPIYYGLSDQDQDYVINTLKQLLI